MSKILGRGLQFIVYDAGEKVKKVPNSESEIKETLLRWSPRYYVLPGKLENRCNRIIQERNRRMELLQNKQIPGWLIGNPRFLPDHSYLQDKLVVFRDSFHTLCDEGKIDEAKDLFDRYIIATFICWSYGFSEVTYNYTNNFGIDHKKNIAVIDLGELFFTYRSVATTLRNKWFVNSWSLRKDTPSNIQSYCRTKMLQELTLANLIKYWNSKRNSVDS